SALLREIALAGRDHDRLLLHEIPDLDAALLHRRQRSVAAVGGQPGRPAYGCRGIPGPGAEASGALPPEPADCLRLDERDAGELALARVEVSAGEAQL